MPPVSSVLKIDWAVNQGCCLKCMFVSIFLFRNIFQEVYMFAIANVNSTGGFSAKFMEMLIGKISAEFDFVIMVAFVFYIDSFSGYGAEPVVMAVIAFPENFGAAGYFVHMFLLFPAAVTVALIMIHIKTPFFF